MSQGGKWFLPMKIRRYEVEKAGEASLRRVMCMRNSDNGALTRYQPPRKPWPKRREDLYELEPLEARVMLTGVPRLMEYAYVADGGQGRVVVAGTLWDGSSLGLIRLNANGSPDRVFGAKGLARIPDEAFVNQLSVLRDGKVLVLAAKLVSVNQDYAYVQRSIYRLTAQGELDATFGDSGRVVLPMRSLYEEAAQMVVLDGGAIVAAAVQYNHLTNDITVYDGLPEELAFIRYTPEGKLDNTFADHGVSILQPAGYFNRMQMMSNGDIGVLLGYVNNQPMTVARSPADGSSAPSAVTLDLQTSFLWYPLTLLPDGRVWMFANRTDSGLPFVIRQYSVHGELDATFGRSGELTLNSGPVDWAFAAEPWGDDVVFGLQQTPYGAFQLVKVTTDGSLDTSFGTDGWVVLPREPERFGSDLALAPMSGGGWVTERRVGGDGFNNLIVDRLDATGQPLSTFGRDGRVILDFVDSYEITVNDPLQSLTIPPGNRPDALFSITRLHNDLGLSLFGEADDRAILGPSDDELF